MTHSSDAWWLQAIENPFAQIRVDSAWQSMSADVASVNEEAFRQCRITIADVLRTHASHGVLLVGEPGTGKTHLLWRLRRWMDASQAGAFVYVRPVTTPDRFNRHVLQALAADLLRHDAARSQTASSQLEIALARLCGAPVHGPGQVQQWWTTLRAERTRLAVREWLLEHLASSAEALQLDAGTVRVVASYAAGLHRLEASAWLQGRTLTDDQIQMLGVAAPLDDEERARDALETLARLAGEQAAVVLAFDQIEALRVTPDDNTALVAWAHGVADLLGRLSNVAIITCLQVKFLADLKSTLDVALFDGRIAERQTSLQRLDAAAARQIVAQRLMVATDLQMARAFLRRNSNAVDSLDGFWPIGRKAVDLLALPGVTARQLLIRCRQLYDERVQATENRRLAGTGPEAPWDSTRQPPEPSGEPSPEVRDTPRSASAFDHVAGDGRDVSGDSLSARFEAVQQDERSRDATEVDDGVYADGLLRAFDVQPSRGRAERGARRDIDVVIAAASGRIAVSVCNTRHMTSLAARLRRLRAAGESAGDRLVMIRDARLPISPTARATREYLRDLEARGASMVRSSAEAYAALAAIRRLISDAAAGDLVVDGTTVEPETLKAWLASNLPDAVAGLLDDIAEPLAAAYDDRVDRLREVLDGAWVLSLEDLAHRSDLPLDDVRTLAARHADLFGTLAGPPAVVFLVPEAPVRP